MSPSTPAAAPPGRGDPRLRRLDRTVGSAVVAGLGLAHRARGLPQPLRRIGLMKSTGVGDMILAAPVVSDIAAAFPESDVVLFAGPDNQDIARLVEGVRVVEIQTAKPRTTLPRLRHERLDALLDFGQWARLEAIYSALSAARWTGGFDTPGQRRNRAYDATVVHSDRVPELENFRRLAGLLGVDSRSEPSFPASLNGDRPAEDPYVVFHLWPGGFRSDLREWPADSWRELARLLAAEGNAIVLTGGPADVERTDAFVASCADLDARFVSVAGRYRLSELIPILAGARAVVSVNTGVMHLAAAAGAPTVALNGPTSATRWGPIGANVVCVDSELPGCGYLNLGFEYDGRRTDCMRGISVERVARAVAEHARA